MNWSGELTIGDGWARYSGVSGDNDTHAHYAAQLITVSGNRIASVLLEGETIRARYIYVPSGKRHQLLATSDQLQIFYIEPALIPATNGDHREPVETVSRTAMALCQELCNRSPNDVAPTSRPIDDRIRNALALIEWDLDSSIRLASIGRSCGLSKSRFAELFRRDTGLPLRQYVLWRRLRRALVGMSDGLSATDAAHSAGFSDSAHFSRTMKAMFGVSPSSIKRGVKIITEDGFVPNSLSASARETV